MNFMLDVLKEFIRHFSSYYSHVLFSDGLLYCRRSISSLVSIRPAEQGLLQISYYGAKPDISITLLKLNRYYTYEALA